MLVPIIIREASDSASISAALCGQDQMQQADTEQSDGWWDAVDPFRLNTLHAFISPDRRPTSGNISTNLAAAFL